MINIVLIGGLNLTFVVVFSYLTYLTLTKKIVSDSSFLIGAFVAIFFFSTIVFFNLGLFIRQLLRFICL